MQMSNERIVELLQQGREAKNRESYSLALQYYNTVLEHDPSNWEAKMYISLIDKMRISCSESDFAIRSVKAALSDVAGIIAKNVHDKKSRDFYCCDVAATASRFAFYIFDLHHADFDRLVMERTRFNRRAPVQFCEDYMKPRLRTLSKILYDLADDLNIQFPAGEGAEGAKIAKEAGKTMREISH